MTRYQRLPLDKLIVDSAYQRGLDERRVDKIVDEFDPALLGTLEVSHRNGKSAIFDGQHRFAALKKLGAKDAPCIVHKGLSVPDEAMLFVRLQTQRKALRPLDRFKARMAAGEEKALEIHKCVQKYGYTIAEGGGTQSYIGSVAALDRIYDRGGVELLARTLDLVSVYKGEPKGTDGHLIEGIAVALHKYKGDKRLEQLPAALEEITAASIVRKALAMLEDTGGRWSRVATVAKVVSGLVGIRGPYKKRQQKAAAA